MAFLPLLVREGEQWRPRCDPNGTLNDDEKAGTQRLKQTKQSASD